ncbi:MAG: hypothetical protein ACTHK8_01945 [Ginsengibacter sp.]
MTRLITLFAFLFITQFAFTQNLDSMVRATKPDSLGGKIITYYTPGKKDVAIKLQNLARSAASYYEKLYGTPFKCRLAVLDSLHWPNDMAPYGIIFSYKGWVFMHAGMSFESFQKVYGMQNFKDVTQKAMRLQNISKKQMVESFLEFYTVHEVGHYFLNSLSGALYPDYFTNEWMASYFAYQYFKKNRPSVLPSFDLFCQLYRDNIKPDHTTVTSFNSNWGNDNIPTYGWYHVNFYFLCKDIYNCAGEKLLPQYRKAFPKTVSAKLLPEEIIKKLEMCVPVLKTFEDQLNNHASAAKLLN